jgi:hypothetical protein
MNRRNFIGRTLSAIGGLFVAHKAMAIAPGFNPVEFDYAMQPWRTRREPIIVTGSTPEYLIKGVKGETYAMATYQYWKCWTVKLDGVTVDMRCSEADSVAGWARLFDIEDRRLTKYNRVPLDSTAPIHIKECWRHLPSGEIFSTDEFMEKRYVQSEWERASAIERIHFGNVEFSYTCQTPGERAKDFIESWNIAVIDPCANPCQFTTHGGWGISEEGLFKKCLEREINTGIVMDLLRRRYYEGVKPIPWAESGPGVTIDFNPVQQLQ